MLDGRFTEAVPLIGAYKTRLLPPEDWERLRPLPFATNGLPDSNAALIIVTENSAGEIVGLWSLLLMPFLDGLWVHPEHRGTNIAGQLLREMKATLDMHGVLHAFTLVESPAVAVLAEKAGFVRMRGDLWRFSAPTDAATKSGG